MQLLISDANILIDLEEGELLLNSSRCLTSSLCQISSTSMSSKPSMGICWA